MARSSLINAARRAGERDATHYTTDDGSRFLLLHRAWYRGLARGLARAQREADARWEAEWPARRQREDAAIAASNERSRAEREAEEAQREASKRREAQRRATMAELIHFAVGDIAAHEGFTTKRHADDVWTPENESGWTYQEVTGAHGRVLYEGPSEEKARAELDAWLVCDAPSSGAYCYSHNPSGGR